MPAISPPLFYTDEAFLNTLATAGFLHAYEITHILNQSAQEKIPVLDWLIQFQKIPSKYIAQQLAHYLNLDFFDLTEFKPADSVLKIIDEGFIRQHHVLPLFVQDEQLYLAISRPAQLAHVGEIKFHTDLQVHPVVVEHDKLARLINAVVSESHYKTISQLSTSTENNEQIIFLVEQLLKDAINKRASDIHIEPSKTAYRIRFRLDGILHKITQLPLDAGMRIIARLKIMARLDMAERRLPQDGRFNIEISSHVSKDCRMSICPTLFGEKSVIRILDANQLSLDIDDLGFEAEQKDIFLQAIKKQQGMVLVTGPTGSGKTVTLYSALNFLNSLEKNICTVEDPVEITLPGINQIHIDQKIQLTFSKVLRSFLRQDPDILMIGEIRDQETAEIAIKAAQTGHLVLSTLHTNSAIETLFRLSTLGISHFNIAHSVQLIIAQRLVRKLCMHCKQPSNISLSKLKNPDVKNIYKAVGCAECMQGYKGRVAIFECLALSPEIVALVAQGKSAQEIATVAQNTGMLWLHESAMRKVSSDITTLEEIQRVL